MLLDVMLPDISGIEVCRQIKEDRNLEDIFIILTSGIQTSSEFQAEGLGGGADGYIVKPVSNKELVARVQSMERIKRAEDALRASEARYRRLFEASSDGILILDATTNEITDVNPGLTKMTGYSRQHFVGKKPWETPLFKETETITKVFENLRHEGFVRYDDMPLNAKDGREISAQFVSNVYAVNRRRVIQCNIRDTTARRQAELEKEELIAELKEALGKIKTLSGMLPICASCKKIRNDAGYWEQIESFLRDHSDAEFSHGICPDCAKKLYPEYFKEKLKSH
jgi:PAS domain S-box-containing protein